MQDIEIEAQPSAEADEFAHRDVALFFAGRLRTAIENVPDELKQLTELQLDDRVRPSVVEWNLRKRVSEKVKEARVLKKDHIPTARIYEDLTARSWFEDHLITNPLKVAWIIRPMIHHTDMYEAINRVALAKIFQIVSTSEIDPKLLPQILRVAEQAGNRAYGAVAQKMQIQSRNLNVEVKQGSLPPSPGQEDIQKQIQALQSKLLEAPKDVTPPKDAE